MGGHMLMRPIGDAELRFGRKDRWLQSRLVRTGRRLMAALLLTSLSCGAAPAQEWPSRTIRAIVPLTAGSATDIVARTVLEQVSGQVGQPILIENRLNDGKTTGMAAA